MRWRVSNLKIKMVALALALVTWFALRGQTIETSDWLDCPVTVVLPDDVTVRDRTALIVEIRVQGPIDKLDRFRPDAETLRLDAREQAGRALANGQPSGIVSLSLEARHFRLPSRVEIAHAPRSIEFKVERLVDKTLPIVVDTTTFGSPADGYRVVETRAVPSTITLRLGAEQAARITEVRTLPVNLAGCAESVRDVAHLLDPRSATSRQLPETVEVAIRIEPELVEKVLSPVPVLVLRPPANRRTIDIQPVAVDITVRGRADVLASLGPEAVVAYLVLVEALDPGVSYDLPLTVFVKKPGVEVIETPSVAVRSE